MGLKINCTKNGVEQRICVHVMCIMDWVTIDEKKRQKQTHFDKTQNKKTHKMQLQTSSEANQFHWKCDNSMHNSIPFVIQNGVVKA